MTNARQRRQRALTFLVFLVAGVTLVESWFACVAAAEAGGRPLPLLWPTTLEAFAIILILVAWDSLVDGRPARLVRLLLFVTTLVMAAVQVLDAPATALGFITAAWTPVGLNLCVEVGVRLRYDAQRRATEARDASRDADADLDAASRDADVTRDVTTRDDTRREDVAPSRRRAIERAARFTPTQQRGIRTRHAQGMTATAIARDMKVDAGAVRVAVDAIKVASNGHATTSGGSTP